MQTDLAMTVAWWGFALAFVFGAVASRTNFCAMGAVADAVNIGSFSRMRMWLLAIATAVLGANALDVLGLIDLGKSIYPSPRFIWLSNIVGGLLFGAGMTLASGCPNKTLIRIGGGNLKSIVVFVFIGISAYMTLRGLFGALRVGYLEPAATTLQTQQDLPSMIAAAAGIDRDSLQPIVAVVLAGAILIYVFKDREFRRDVVHIAGGLTVGLLVAAAWYVTAHLGYVAEDPNTLEEAFAGTDSGRAESFSFVAPLAYSLELLMLWTDRSKFVSFGIASVLGIVAGSLCYALVSRTFRWEGFAGAADTRNHIVGAILMGFGGVTALGCTIGQAISGISTLALGSIITFLAIVAGSAATMKFWYWKMLRES